MTPIRSLASRLLVSGAAAFAAALSLPAAAQMDRTWVASYGVDSDACSREAPCATFAGALAKTNVNGEVNCLDSGGFGAMAIVRSVSIDCHSALGSVLFAGQVGLTINAAGATVSLRGLLFDGVANGSTGIFVQNVSRLNIEDTVIRNATSNGIYIAAGNARVTLRSSVVRGNAGHGVWLQPASGTGSTRLAIVDSTLAANGLTGLRVDDNGVATMVDSVSSGNGTHGVTASSGGGLARIVLERVTSSQNANGGVLVNGAGAEMYLSEVVTTGNSYGLYPPLGGGRYFSFGNNKSSGNTNADTAVTMPVSNF